MKETPPSLVVRGSDSGYTLTDLREAWRYRELLLLLSWRDIKIRYAQTMIGFTWTVLQPLLSTGVFTVLFGKLAQVPSEGFPYAVYNYAAFLPWVLFANCISRASNSLVDNGYLLSRVYFPRILLPVGAMLPSLLDFAIGMTALIPMFWYYGLPLNPAVILLVPLLALLTVSIALGLSLILSAVNVHVRDIGNLMPFTLQLAMWLTPITYPVSLVPERYRSLVYLNPMTGVVEGFRSALLAKPWDWTGLGVSVAFACVALALGVYWFRSVERTFADVV